MSLTVVLSGEAAIALRQRLNEATEQLDALRKDHAELEVKWEGQDKELTIAKSNCKVPCSCLNGILNAVI
jgi:phage shock protein A